MFPDHHQLPEGSISELKKTLLYLTTGLCPIFNIACVTHGLLQDNLASEYSTSPFDEARLDKYLEVVKSIGRVFSIYLLGPQLKYNPGKDESPEARTIVGRTSSHTERSPL